MRTAVLTISTSVSRREADDESGPLLAQLAEEAGCDVEVGGRGRRCGGGRALGRVSVAVPAGATRVVFGPNGGGKWTLLRVLATLLRPQGGTARVLGSELPREAWRVRGQIGLLGHEP